MDYKIALVTGVTRPTGLGLGLVKGLAVMGYSVLASGREPARVEPLLEDESFSGKAEPLEQDITDNGSLEKAVDFISEKYGKLDALINNAA